MKTSLLLLCLMCSSCGMRSEPGRVDETMVTIYAPSPQVLQAMPATDSATFTEYIHSTTSGTLRIRTPGWMTAEIKQGSSITPVPAKDGAALTITADSIRGSTGGAENTSAILMGMHANFWMGILLIIGGGIIWLAKSKAVALVSNANVATGFIAQACAKLPKGTGLLIMCVGVGVIVLPYVLEVAAPIIMYGAAGAVCILLAWWVWNIIQHEAAQNNAAAKAAVKNSDPEALLETQRMEPLP